MSMEVVGSPAAPPKGPPSSTLSRSIYGLSVLGLFADGLRMFFWAGGGALLAVFAGGFLGRRTRGRWPIFGLGVLGAASGFALDLILDNGLDGILSDPIGTLMLTAIASFIVGGIFIGSGGWILKNIVLPGATQRGSVIEGASLLLFVGFLWTGIGVFRAYMPPGPDDIRLEAPEVVVSVARDLIEQYGDRAQGAPLGVMDVSVPVELQDVGDLTYVRVFPDHVSLVFVRGPDCQDGVRIWSEDATTVHEDEPTRYSDIYVYGWCDDFPDSPSNLP